jgi:receptor protein-tyrosine kinase
MSNSAPRIIVLCAMACLGLGFAGVLLHDRLDKRIRYPDQVTGSLGLPVLGVVPQLKASTPPGGPAAAIAIESFRGLRTQIAHVDGRIDGIHLVTSPAPREGKSMVAANLAISFATAGHSTVLVDGDTRRGRAQDMFQLARSPGLTDILLERASLTEATQQTEVDNLALISRGSSRGFNADLLDGARMDDLLEALRADYEIVVIDGPPLAAGADVLMLGQRSDKVMLVLRAGATREDLARAKLETMGNVQIPIIGAVLNAMPKSTPYYDHYVHYYYADAELAS